MAVYFWTVYSMGLRLSEGLNLQVGDIDADGWQSPNSRIDHEEVRWLVMLYLGLAFFKCRKYFRSCESEMCSGEHW